MTILWCKAFNSEGTRRTYIVDSTEARYVHWFVLLAWMWTGYNQLTGTITSELGELTSSTRLDIGTWIGFSCWHEWHGCSHFLAILFEQILINSRVQFRANSENLSRWLYCISVPALVCLVHACHACSHLLDMEMIWLATSIKSFVMDHFCSCLSFRLIALLKLFAADALNVIFNADKGTYSVINEDFITDNVILHNNQ
jgi:hypothetical protein